METKKNSRLQQRLREYAKSPSSAILAALVMLCTAITFFVLLFLIVFILVKGVTHITPDLFFFTYTTENASLMPALINTLIMTALSLVIAVPIGVASAIFLVEYAGKGSKLVGLIRITAETLSGIPSIVYGLFGLLFFATTLQWGYSLLSGSFTLVIMILPLIMRTTEEALKAVPDSYREASFGLGRASCGLSSVSCCLLRFPVSWPASSWQREESSVRQRRLCTRQVPWPRFPKA